MALRDRLPLLVLGVTLGVTCARAPELEGAPVARRDDALVAGPLRAVTSSAGVGTARAPEFGPWEPRGAWDGTQWLVVWADHRAARNQIFAARLSALGAVLDPRGIPLGTGGRDLTQFGAGVTWDGANFIVTWTESDASDVARVYASRLTRAGQNLDPGGVVLASGSTRRRVSQGLATAAGQGVTLQVMLDGTFSSYDISFQRVGANLALLDAAPRAVTSGGRGAYEADVGFDGTDFIVVWTESGLNVRAARVTTAGVVRDPGGVLLRTWPESLWSPRVHCVGARCVAAWIRDQTPTSHVDTRVLDFAAVGTGASIADAGLRPSLALGDGVLVGERSSQVVISLDGGSFVPVLPTTAFYNEAAALLQSPGAKALLVFPQSNPPTLTVSRVSGATVEASFPISLAAARQDEVAVAVGSTSSLAVFTDDRSGFKNLYAVRVSAAGVVLDDPPIRVAAKGVIQAFPRVTFNGTDFVVAWTELTGPPFSPLATAYAARVTEAGTSPDAPGRALTSPSTNGEVLALADDGAQTWALVRTAGALSVFPMDRSAARADAGRSFPSVSGRGDLALADGRVLLLTTGTLDGGSSGLVLREVFDPSPAGARVLPTQNFLREDVALVRSNGFTFAAWKEQTNANRLLGKAARLEPDGGLGVAVTFRDTLYGFDPVALALPEGVAFGSVSDQAYELRRYSTALVALAGPEVVVTGVDQAEAAFGAGGEGLLGVVRYDPQDDLQNQRVTVAVLSSDGGFPDAGSGGAANDAGVGDAGKGDGGLSASDAGPDDGGLSASDAGPDDGGSLAGDAGEVDPGPAGPRGYAVGCGCRAGESLPSGALLWGLLALARRPRPRPLPA